MFVCILYLNIQITQHFFFWPTFLSPSTHDWFQDKGCVSDGVPEGVGAGNQHGFITGQAHGY